MGTVVTVLVNGVEAARRAMRVVVVVVGVEVGPGTEEVVSEVMDGRAVVDDVTTRRRDVVDPVLCETTTTADDWALTNTSLICPCDATADVFPATDHWIGTE